jgi:dipeptidyl aminopeptidase/acylaminoacyl peptidase
MTRPGAPSIAEVSAPELRLAGLRINPDNYGPSRGGSYDGLAFRELDGTERPVSGLPTDPRITDVRWSPDGTHVAFLNTREDRIELWVLEVASGEARRLLDRPVNAAFYGAPYDWVDDQTLVVRTVPEGHGAPPEAPGVPSGPVIQETTGEAAPARTYQDLLEDPHDEAVFEHYTTAQLVRVGLDGAGTELGEPDMIRSVQASPDGRYLLAETTHRPFSYLVPAYRFPTRIEVWDREGAVVHELADLPLQEQVPTAFGSVPIGPRSVSWRADEPATLAWTEALDEGDAGMEAEERDRVFTLAAPFDGEPTAIATLPLRFGGVYWSDEGFALVAESWFATRQVRMYEVDPDDPGEPEVLLEYSMEDRYANPGRPLTTTSAWGTPVLRTTDGGRTLFMTGQGASPEGNRPFLRTLDRETGETEELFRSTEPYYEMPVALVDEEEGLLLTRRETTTEPPNFWLRDLDGGDAEPVTDFPHPYPELADIQAQVVEYEREDGVPLTAKLYLPPGYDAEEDGPLPTFVWAYPTEFKSADAAGQRSDSPYQFKSVSYWGAVPYVTRGYAVLDDASMPIIGEGEEEPNDTFRDQLVANAQAAIDEGVRRGVVDPDRVAIGGHSYGAFMTGNLLAHSDLFRAGVARSGAYNRTLTPFGFQREERLFWEAPEIYFGMSPFMHADKVDEPILLIHGAADNNSGTFPIQSIRFYNAVKGLGGTARLVMLPAESHGYAARESLLHMLWETDRWLDEYVKNAEPRDRPVSQEDGS